MSLCLDTAFSHDPGLSRLVLVVEDGSITAAVELAREDAAALERAAGPSWPLEALDVRVDGTAAAPELLDRAPRDRGALEVVLLFRAERSGRGGRLDVRSRMLGSLPRGHRQVAAVARRDGSRLAARLLHGGEDRIECEGGAAGPEERPSFAGFLGMGLEHILDGWDHLLFLLALLLGARTFLQGLKLITAFSAAHSITLVLSVLEVVSLHPRIVEPLIAASIVHAGAANLLGRRAGAGLAFAFGLVHGLGFSYALCEAGIQPGWAAALPLLGFNAGVELGQAAMAALVFPWIVRLRPSPAFSARLAPVLSALIAACGACWLIERTLF